MSIENRRIGFKTSRQIHKGLPEALEKLVGRGSKTGPQIFFKPRHNSKIRFYLYTGNESEPLREVFFSGMDAIHRVVVFHQSRPLVNPLYGVSQTMLRSCRTFVLLEASEISGHHIVRRLKAKIKQGGFVLLQVMTSRKLYCQLH